MLGTLSAQGLPGMSQQQIEEEEEPAFSEDPYGRNTPRGTVSGFISAVAEQDYERASQFLHLGRKYRSQTEGERLARVLQSLLDHRGYLMPYSRISNDPEGATDDNVPSSVDRVGTVTADGKKIDLLVEATEGPDGGPIWLFSLETINAIAAASIEGTLLLERILPPILQKNMWWGVPVGHWLAVLVLAAIAYLLAWGVTAVALLIITKTWHPAGRDPLGGILRALAFPVRLYVAVWFFVALSQEVGISIIVRQRFSGITALIGAVALLILLWRLTEFIGSFSKERMSQRGNVSAVSVVLFMRRAAKVAIVVFGVIMILDTFGVDVTAGLAALGIGGIALALGAQKSMENFVGSVTLIADQPVRVGDFCKVGDIVGTVENIGMRSTRIRTLARTIVTIPNGEFSSAKIENYAHRDRFWFNPELSLRYETTPDQIRYLLVELRSVLYSHPLVSPDPARIRFTKLGSDSINLSVFAYLLVSSFDEFLEVQEDLLLRMMDVVAKSGTGFAFPSQTIYMARDGGLSEEKSKAAEETVRKWRENNELQIPGFDPDRIEEIKDSIPYPPEGSVKGEAKKN